MHELIHRLLVLLWFVAYMAAIYLGAAHRAWPASSGTRIAACSGSSPWSPDPLTAPVRAVLPRGVPEGRVRWITLALCAAIWLGARIVLARMGG